MHIVPSLVAVCQTMEMCMHERLAEGPLFKNTVDEVKTGPTLTVIATT